MPTKAEFDALPNATKVWDGTNKGYTFGTSPNIIFLPAAGYGNGTGLGYAGARGYYWSSSLNSSNPNEAYCLFFNVNFAATSNGIRYIGHSVRALSE